MSEGNSITLPTPTRSGYTFNGWYTSSTGGTKAGTAGSIYKPTADIKLIAQWTKEDDIIYTVTYWVFGGTVFPSSEEVTTEGSIIYLPEPEKDGYTFDGWYSEASGGTRVGSAGDFYVPTDSINLYAQWLKTTVTSTPVLKTTVTQTRTTTSAPTYDIQSDVEELKKRTDDLEEKTLTLEERLTKQETMVEMILNFFNSIFG